jgi:hypothetical protein
MFMELPKLGIGASIAAGSATNTLVSGNTTIQNLLHVLYAVRFSFLTREIR